MHVVPDDVGVQGCEHGGDHAHSRGVQSPADLEHEQCRRHGDERLRQADDEPRAVERPVESREEERVERLRVRRRHVGEEPERPALDQRAGEAVALLDELLEDLLRSTARTASRGKPAAATTRSRAPRDTSRVGGGTAQRYAVVSCHVERVLDDAVWHRYRALLARPPGGFSIASLARPADPAHGEDERAWLARVQEAAAFGPVGHRTHWTALITRGRRRPGPASAFGEGERLLELGLRPALFCGGGWYTDSDVAEACAALGYVDCTACRDAAVPRRGRRVGAAGRTGQCVFRRVRCCVRCPTRSLGSLARALWSRRGPRAGRPRLLPRHRPARPSPALAAPRRPLRARPSPSPGLGGRSRGCRRRPGGCLGGRGARPTCRKRDVESRRAEQGRHDGAAERHASAPAAADVRASRLYLLSRGTLFGLVRRAASIAALVVLDVVGLSLGLYAALVLRQVVYGETPIYASLLWREGPQEWLPFLAPITVLLFLQAGLAASRERRPGRARARLTRPGRARRPRIRPRHGLRLPPPD